MQIESYHPGVTVQEIRDETDWPLKVAPDVAETPEPSREEILAVRKYDPQGVWTS